MRTDEALGTDALELNSAITAFLHDAEERGHVAAAELEALQVEHDLDEEAVEALRAALAAADVEIEEAAEDAEVELDLRPSAPTGTTDSLQLFLNEIGRHDLLTAAEEVALAKRIEPVCSEVSSRARRSPCDSRVSMSTVDTGEGKTTVRDPEAAPRGSHSSRILATPSRGGLPWRPRRTSVG